MIGKTLRSVRALAIGSIRFLPIVLLSAFVAVMLLMSGIRMPSASWSFDVEADGVVVVFSRDAVAKPIKLDRIDLFGEIEIACASANANIDDMNSVTFEGATLSLAALRLRHSTRWEMHLDESEMSLRGQDLTSETAAIMTLAAPSAVFAEVCPARSGAELSLVEVAISGALAEIVMKPETNGEIPFSTFQASRMTFARIEETDEFEALERGTIRDGKLWIEYKDDEGKSITAIDELRFSDLSDTIVYIEEPKTDNSVRFVAEGRGNSIETERSGKLINLKPTLFDWAASSSLIRAIGALATLLGGLQIGFFLKDKGKG